MEEEAIQWKPLGAKALPWTCPDCIEDVESNSHFQVSAVMIAAIVAAMKTVANVSSMIAVIFAFLTYITIKNVKSDSHV